MMTNAIKKKMILSHKGVGEGNITGKITTSQKSIENEIKIIGKMANIDWSLLPIPKTKINNKVVWIKELWPRVIEIFCELNKLFKLMTAVSQGATPKSARENNDTPNPNAKMPIKYKLR
jgi:hypothetical protein